MAMHSISDDLKKTLARSGIARPVEAAFIVERAVAAIESVFHEESRHARPQYVKNRTLTVACDSGAFAQELKLQEQKILTILNADLDAMSRIERIRYLL